MGTLATMTYQDGALVDRLEVEADEGGDIVLWRYWDDEERFAPPAMLRIPAALAPELRATLNRMGDAA